MVEVESLYIISWLKLTSQSTRQSCYFELSCNVCDGMSVHYSVKCDISNLG